MEEDQGVVGQFMGMWCLYNKYEVAGEVPLMACRGAEGWRVWSRGQSNQCLRGSIALEETWRYEGRGAGARPIPGEFALNSGRITGATRLVAKRMPETVNKAVNQKEGIKEGTKEGRKEERRS